MRSIRFHRDTLSWALVNLIRPTNLDERIQLHVFDTLSRDRIHVSYHNVLAANRSAFDGKSLIYLVLSYNKYKLVIENITISDVNLC